MMSGNDQGNSKAREKRETDSVGAAERPEIGSSGLSAFNKFINRLNAPSLPLPSDFDLDEILDGYSPFGDIMEPLSKDVREIKEILSGMQVAIVKLHENQAETTALLRDIRALLQRESESLE